MVFEHIEKLKREFTDKYVMIATNRPELARFQGVVGQVKTVNMSGRALVEFDQYHSNIGWYDIDLSNLKIVDKPAPKEPEPKAKSSDPKPAAQAKPAPSAGEKKLSPLEMARAQGAAKKEAGDKPTAAKPSVQEMLAKARTEKAPAGEAVSEASAPAPAAKPDRAKMSVSDMLAAARGEKAGGAVATPAPQAKAEPPVAEVVETEAEPEHEEPVVEVAEETVAPASAGQTAAATKVDRSKMTVSDMLAWCRQHDTK